jgi:hypothetical protein
VGSGEAGLAAAASFGEALAKHKKHFADLHQFPAAASPQLYNLHLHHEILCDKGTAHPRSFSPEDLSSLIFLRSAVQK